MRANFLDLALAKAFVCLYLDAFRNPIHIVQAHFNLKKPFHQVCKIYSPVKGFQRLGESTPSAYWSEKGISVGAEMPFKGYRTIVLSAHLTY